MPDQITHRSKPTLQRVRQGVVDVRLAIRQRALQLGRHALESLARIVEDPEAHNRDRILAAAEILRVAGMEGRGCEKDDEQARDRFHQLIQALRTRGAHPVHPSANENEPAGAMEWSPTSCDDGGTGGDTRSPAPTHDDLAAHTHFSSAESAYERVVDVDEDGNVIAAEDVYVVETVKGIRLVDLE